MSRTDELRKLAEQWNEAWNGGDAQRLAAFFADDATLSEPSLPEGPVPGKTGIVESAESTWKMWPGVSFEAVSILVDGDRVAVEWRSSATHHSGKAVNLEGVDILEFRGDQIASARVYYDIYSRKEAVG